VVLLTASAFSQTPPHPPGIASKPGNATPAAVKDALTLEAQGKNAEAEAAWKAVVKAQPRNAQAFAHLGLVQARQEHYPEAIANYRKAKALNPGIPQLNLNLGLALFKSGSFREAEREFELELKGHPSDAEAKHLTTLAGMSYYGAHDYAAAVPFLKQAAAEDSRNLELLLALAHCYLWTKQFDATMGIYKEILEIDPDSAEADMIAGEALDEKGDNAGAVQQFRAAEKANPKEPNVHFGLAYLLWAQKRYEEAIPEFEAELANDPKNYQAMIYLGDTYTQMNDFEHARKVLEVAAKYEDAMPLIHLDLGIVYQETGNAETAQRELKRTVALEPDNVNAHFRLAKVYQAMGDREQAKVEFAKASSLNKKTDDALYNRIAAANARPDAETKTDKGSTAPEPDGAAKPN
jgi:tetratricopeptide (TPR) repeat protein